MIMHELHAFAGVYFPRSAGALIHAFHADHRGSQYAHKVALINAIAIDTAQAHAFTGRAGPGWTWGSPRVSTS